MNEQVLELSGLPHSENLEPAPCWNVISGLLFCQLLLQVSGPRAYFEPTWLLGILTSGQQPSSLLKWYPGRAVCLSLGSSFTLYLLAVCRPCHLFLFPSQHKLICRALP